MQVVTRTSCLLATVASITLLALPAQAGVEFPPLDDPQLVDWGKRASADLDRYLADPQGTFAMPAEGKPFPCEVTPEDVSRIIGVRLPGAPPDEEFRKAAARAARGTGAKPMEFVDVVVRPSETACKDGKPAGWFKGWAEFTMVNTTAVSVTRTRMRKYLETEVGSGGAPTGVIAERILTLDSQTDYTDPAMAALMRQTAVAPTKVLTAVFQYTLVNADKSRKALAVNRTTMTGPSPSTSTSTTVTRPKGPARWVMVMYDGANKTAEMPFRDNRLHGPTINYPRKFNGIDLPGSTTCYDDGEVIKTTQCDVE